MTILERSESRDGYAVRVLAVHTTEGTSYGARGLRDATWWEGSSHAIADDRELLTPEDGCVPYSRASWTLRAGNRWSENLELCAFARWTTGQWMTHPVLLDHAARWLAARSVARRIPLVKLTPDAYYAGGRGVIGHHDHTVAYKREDPRGSHWDPGPHFPWDHVLTSARNYAGPAPEGFLVGLSDKEQTEALALLRQVAKELMGPDWQATGTLGWPVERPGVEPPGKPVRRTLLSMVAELFRETTQRLDRAQPATGPDTHYGHTMSAHAAVRTLLARPGVDVDALATAMADRLGKRLDSGVIVTRADVVSAVREVFADAAT